MRVILTRSKVSEQSYCHSLKESDKKPQFSEKIHEMDGSTLYWKDGLTILRDTKTASYFQILQILWAKPPPPFWEFYKLYLIKRGLCNFGHINWPPGMKPLTEALISLLQTQELNFSTIRSLHLTIFLSLAT